LHALLYKPRLAVFLGREPEVFAEAHFNKALTPKILSSYEPLHGDGLS
jgi:hypothetical protein